MMSLADSVPSLALDEPSDSTHDRLLWREFGVALLPLTAALGPYFIPIPVGDITIYAYRALVLLLSVTSVLVFTRFDWWDIPITRTYATLGAAWIFWAALSAFRAPSLERALVEVAALGFGFVTGLTMLQMRSHVLPTLHALRIGWVLAFLATGAVAIWELTTGQHLPSSAVERAPPGGLQGIAISTFGNQNNFAAFLLLAAPFLFWSHAVSKSRVRRTVYALCLLALPLLLFLTASRVSLLGLLAQAGLLWLISPRYRSKLLVYLIVLGALGFGVFQVLDMEVRMLYELSVMLGGDGLGTSGGSVAKRWNLVMAGLWLLVESMGFGVGPGGFEMVLRQRIVPFDTGGLVNPHNFWIEVLSQYGVLIFGAFVVWIVYLARQVDKRRRRASLDPESLESRQVAETILVGLAGYLFAAVANSTYMVQSTHWMFWASIVVMAAYLWRKRLIAVLPVDAPGGSGASLKSEGGVSSGPRTTDGEF